MSKTREQKTELLERYKAVLAEADGYIMVNSESLDAATLTDLKKELKEINANFAVVKNTLFKIALQDTEGPLKAQEFSGASAIITYSDDPTGPAKLVQKVQKEHEILDPKYGIVNGEYVSKEKIMELADIPPKEVLLGKILGSLNSPLTGAMNAFTGNVRGFVQVLKQLSEKESN